METWIPTYILTQIPLEEINFVAIHKHGNVDTDTSMNSPLPPPPTSDTQNYVRESH